MSMSGGGEGVKDRTRDREFELRKEECNQREREVKRSNY